MDSNKAILDDDKSTLEERLEAFATNAQLEVDLITETAKKKLTDISRYNDEVRDLTNSEISDLLRGNEIKKTLNDSEILALEEYHASILANERRFNKERQKVIDDEISRRKTTAENITTGIITGENNASTGVTNQYIEDLANFKGTEEEKARLKEEYQRKIIQIQRQGITEELNMRIAMLEELSKLDEISVEQRLKLENELSKAKLELSLIDLENKEETVDKELELERQKTEKLMELTERLVSATADLINTLFDARIQKIDEEIEKNNEKYDNWLEKENLTEEQRKEIEAKRAQEEAELEKKKRKEQIKQAIFNKSLKVAEIGMATALGIMQAYAQLGPVGGTIAAVLIGVLGTIQTAAVLATPIPKYELGTKDHKGGHAIVGEKRPEVILEPNKQPYIVDRPSILDLPKHTKVIPSVNEFDKLQRASLLASLDVQMNKLSPDNAVASFDDRYSAEIVQELKKMNKKKMNVIVQPAKVDLGHQIWRSNNIKWHS